MIEQIEQIVCLADKLVPETLHQKTRKREIKEARQKVMVLAMEMGYTQEEAVRYFGLLEHSTAINAKKVIYGYEAYHVGYHDQMEILRVRVRFAKNVRDKIDLVIPWIKNLQLLMQQAWFEFEKIQTTMNKIEKEIAVFNAKA